MIVSLFRTLILFITVMIGVRLMGKRQIGDMSPNELVVTILVSQIATIPLQDMNQPVINGVVSIFFLVVMELVLSVLIMKFGTFRKVVNGAPAIIIKQGKLDQKAMERLRITVDDLQEELRQQQVFDIEEVYFGIVETDGKLSIMLKNDSNSVAVPVICDGAYQTDFMNKMGIDLLEVEQRLAERRLKREEVFLMTLDSKGKATVIKKEGKI